MHKWPIVVISRAERKIVQRKILAGVYSEQSRRGRNDDCDPAVV